MTAKLMMIHCLSPLHAGTGQGVGAVDLPISRETSTGLPSLPGSSIKGSLRDKAGDVFGRGDAEDNAPVVARLFGPETVNAADHAGALSFGDAQLLCLPTRSIYGTFAWVTSPLLLQRLFRDAREAGLDVPVSISTVMSSGHQDVLVAGEGSLLTRMGDHKVFFEDFDLQGKPKAEVSTLGAWIAALLFDDAGDRELFVQRLAIVHDDIMVFLSRYAIDVVTRASIDAETKTVKSGQLWTEENLPSESILVSLVAELPVLARKVPGGAFERLDEICKGAVQFGGHATIGRGRARVSLRGGAR